MTYFDNLWQRWQAQELLSLHNKTGGSPMAEPATPTVPDGEIGDVADMLNVSERTAYRLAERGEIPSYRIGGRMRFDLAEVAAAIHATRTPA